MASIANYLNLSYRRNVMGEDVDPDSALPNDAETVAALKAELARIKAKGIDMSKLSRRDFATYQHVRAIEAALARLENKDAS